MNYLKKLGAFKSVTNYDGKPNQFELRFESGIVFQSYDSVIVIKFFHDDKLPKSISNQIFFGKDWNYSSTTSKYRNKFLSRDSKWCQEQVTLNKIKVLEI
jgi:hypothetical protein